MSDSLIEETSLSQGWVTVLTHITNGRGYEMSPLVLSLTDFDESKEIRSLLEKALSDKGLDSVNTVAGTIFPMGIFQLSEDRFKFYDEYIKVIPRIRKVDKRNNRGTYFERLIAYEGNNGEKVNQIEFIIQSLLSETNKRRSKLQASTFDPRVDHMDTPYQGFPCLQHVTFCVSQNGGLVMNSFYAMQYLFQRAYGNWLGLINLGKFVAREAGLKLERFNCFVGVEKLDQMSKEKAKRFLRSLESN